MAKNAVITTMASKRPSYLQVTANLRRLSELLRPGKHAPRPLDVSMDMGIDGEEAIVGRN